MTLKFVIILQNLIKTYHRKSGKSKCDRKVTELNVEITPIRSRVNGVLMSVQSSDDHSLVQPLSGVAQPKIRPNKYTLNIYLSVYSKLTLNCKCVCIEFHC